MRKLSLDQGAMLLFALLLVVPMMAFTLRGGDSFEIYLGKTLAVRQLLHQDKTIKTLDLATATTDDLNVSFDHCGQTGKNRTVSIKDKSLVLKEWRFADIKAGASTKMSIPVKDILTLQKNLNGKQLSLFYTSDMLKEGRVLVTLTSNPTQARVK